MAEVIDSHVNLEEQALIEKIRRGNREAFNVLFEQYHIPIYRYCHLMIGDSFLAEDLYQDTFFTFYRICREGRDIYNVRGYLFSVARSKCLDFIEEKKRGAKLENSSEPFYYPDETSADTMEHFHKALMKLPDQYREAFLLFSIKEYSYEEIALMLDVSKNVVRNRIFRAKQALQKILTPLFKDREN